MSPRSPDPSPPALPLDASPVGPAGGASASDAWVSGASATPAARRRAARALGDAALAAALATGDDAAWAEFDARFRPVLTAYARRVRLPTVYWPRCVDDVLADEAMRLGDGAPVPGHLAAYLVRAAHHALLKCRRDEVRRAARHEAAEGVGAAEPAAYALGGSDPAGDGVAPALDALLRALAGPLSEADRQLLVWVGEQVPRRQIAAWLGDGYDATRKRVQRLVARLRVEAGRYAATRPPAERHEIERFLRRAGYAAPGPPPAARDGAARAAGPAPTPGRAAPLVEEAL